jgi:hypothetical protein
MKKSLIIICLLSITFFFTSSCVNRQSIIKNFRENLKTCLKQCDEMEAKYEKEYADCLKQCHTDLISNLDNCKKITNIPELIACIDRAFAISEECSDQCTQTWEKHKKELEKCKEDCISHTEIK